jgi:tRNA A37 threonylcarbamoyladenosine dehydratase
VFSMQPLIMPESDTSCDIEAAAEGVTGLNCAGFGSAMVVTATFGMIAAAHVLNKLSAAPTDNALSMDPVQAPHALLS